MNRNLVLLELVGGLWHSTHPERFQHILETGAILPEPDIPESERWSTYLGSRYYPYVRTLGGVSLFDFKGFDPDKYTERFPMSSWSYFVPHHRGWGCAAWIEIDRAAVAPQLISPSELEKRQAADSAHHHKRMPEIEATHLGPLPRAAFRRAFLVSAGDDRLHPLSC